MADGVELRSDALMTAAAAQVGLDDFGDEDFVERLDVLLGALRDEAGLSPMGRCRPAGQMGRLLRNRLLLTDLLARHPEIHDVEIERPIVIAGLPRTGTTHLHNLISADPAAAVAALLGEPASRCRCPARPTWPAPPTTPAWPGPRGPLGAMLDRSCPTSSACTR